MPVLFFFSSFLSLSLVSGHVLPLFYYSFSSNQVYAYNMMLFSFKSLQVILPSKACHAIKGILRSLIRVNSLFFFKASSFSNSSRFDYHRLGFTTDQSTEPVFSVFGRNIIHCPNAGSHYQNLVC